MDKEKILEKIKTTKILGIIGVIVTVIALFLPFISYTYFGVSFGSANYLSITQGKITLVLVIITAIMMYSDFIAEKFPQVEKYCKMIENPKYTLVPTAISLILLIFETMDISGASFGIGYFVTWVGLLILVAYGIMYKGNASIAEVKSETPIDEQK